MRRKKYVAIDFDHTLVDGDVPLAGAQKALRLMREANCYIIIHSCNGPEWIRQVMLDNDLPFDEIWNEVGKPVADIYIDDKGYRFMGNWPTAISEILDELQADN